MKLKDSLEVSYPYSLANTLEMSRNEFVLEMKIASMVKLFELGKVSSGTAAKVLGVSRVEFLDLLEKYNVSIFGQYHSESLCQDIANA